MTFLETLAVTPVPCRDPENDPNWWFGDSEDEDEEYGTEHAVAAVRMCQECPIRYACLTQAVTTQETYGVWGAMTPPQREALKGRI